MKKSERRELFREIVAISEELERMKREVGYNGFMIELGDDRRWKK